jgi:molybdopterin-guanine dinucleotide biosynthesis protein B
MKIIAVSGTKNTGKTTLVTKIVKELVNRGFEVGTVKHTHHGFDTEGRDTWKHTEAGAEIVVGSGTETFFTLQESMDLDTILSVLKFIKNPDYIVLESFKYSEYAKICTSDLKDDFTIANVNVFEMDETDLKLLVDLIEERSYSFLQNMDHKKLGFKNSVDLAKAIVNGELKYEEEIIEPNDILLRIDGSIIPMNLFVQDFIKNAVEGMIKSLKTDEFGASDINKIEIIINNK